MGVGWVGVVQRRRHDSHTLRRVRGCPKERFTVRRFMASTTSEYEASDVWSE